MESLRLSFRMHTCIFVYSHTTKLIDFTVLWVFTIFHNTEGICNTKKPKLKLLTDFAYIYLWKIHTMTHNHLQRNKILIDSFTKKSNTHFSWKLIEILKFLWVLFIAKNWLILLLFLAFTMVSELSTKVGLPYIPNAFYDISDNLIPPQCYSWI